MELIGREAELAEVAARLRRRRLVTLVGPGGVGKTALARQVFDDRSPLHAGGGVVVDLTAVDDAEGVASCVAGQLGFADVDSLADRPAIGDVLVLIDNCEHVLDAAADVVDRLLVTSPDVTVVATSRAPLDLPDETVVAVTPLAVPRADEAGGADGADGAAALTLFRARAADLGVLVDLDDAAAAEVCRRLDGVPLAVELAAARLRTRSLTELLAELEARPHALARPRYRGNPNHRSVTELVGWSTNLLAPDRQRFFARLGIFAGTFTAAMAAAVALDDDVDRPPEGEEAAGGQSAAAIDLLDELVAVSLVVADTTGATTRYRLLHPVRAVAVHQMGQAGELAARRGRWVDHVVGLAVTTMIEAGQRWNADLLADLLDLYDNITSALRWLLAEGDPDDDADARRALLLTAVLWGVVHEGHTREVGDLAERVLVRWPDRDRPHWAEAAATAATARGMAGDDEAAIALATAALGHVGSSPFAGSILERVRARSARSLGRLAEARDRFQAGAEAAEATGNLPFALEQWSDHAVMRAATGDVEGALAVIDRVLIDAAEREAPINGVWALACRGIILARSSSDEAEQVFVEVEAWSRELAYAAGVWTALRGLAVVAFDRGDVDAAAGLVADLLDDIGHRGGTGELRSALDIGALIAEQRGLDVWADLAVTARALAVSMVSLPVDPDLFERAAGRGRVLTIREAFVAARNAMDADAMDADAAVEAPNAAVADVAVEAVQHRSRPESADERAGHAVADARREGDLWRFRYEGRTTALRRSKGLDDLVVLLARPGREVAAIDLTRTTVVGGGSRQELLDPTARRRYEERIRELQTDLDEADAAGDLARSERLAAELDTLVDHLTAAVGLGGRAREVSRDGERARSAVTQRLRAALRRIAEHDEVLGAHLNASIRTGTYCSYEPPTTVVWQIEDGGVLDIALDDHDGDVGGGRR